MVTARLRALACCCAGLAPVANAQHRFWIDYPQGLAATQHSNNVIPFGMVAVPRGPFTRSRWQQLIPRGFLPPLACRLEAFAAWNLSPTSEQSYASLQVEVCLTPSDELDVEFDENLRAPLIVLDAVPRSILWKTMEPTRIALSRPFPYDGKSGLVFDIRKAMDVGKPPVHMMVKTGSPEQAVPAPVVNAGDADSTADDSKTGSPQMGIKDPVMLRLEFTAPRALGARVIWAAQRATLEIGRIGKPGTWQMLQIESPAACVPVSARIPEGALCTVRLELPRTPALLGLQLRIRASGAWPPVGWEAPLEVR